MTGCSEMVHFSSKLLLSMLKDLLLREHRARLSANSVHECRGEHLQTGAPPTDQDGGGQTVTVPTTKVIFRQLKICTCINSLVYMYMSVREGEREEGDREREKKGT